MTYDAGSMLLAAVTGVQAPWIAALWPEHDILFRVDDGRRQLWFAVGAQLALRPERARIPVQPHELPHWLETARARDILNGAGLGAPPGWRHALASIGPIAMPDPWAYLLLFDVLSEGGSGAKLLQHAEPVTQPLIEVTAALPADLRDSALIHAFLVRPHGPAADAKRWAWELAQLARVAPTLAAEVVTSVRSGRAPVDILALNSPAWVLPFPDPPWPGTAQLRPLATPQALVDAGARLRNCLSGRLSTVRYQGGYYYEYVGEPGMIVELTPGLVAGHHVRALRLAQNAPPTLEDIALLAAELSGADDILLIPEELLGE